METQEMDTRSQEEIRITENMEDILAKFKGSPYYTRVYNLMVDLRKSLKGKRRFWKHKGKLLREVSDWEKYLESSKASKPETDREARKRAVKALMILSSLGINTNNRIK